MLKIYNTLTNRKDEFQPIRPGKVRMYVCGMTVYDYCHLGHARAMVVFDLVVRYLRASGYEVEYVRNITDIDDKIIARANENGEDFKVLTERFIDALHEDSEALGLIVPDHEPRATDHIGEMLEMIKTLIANGKAYAADNGDVYYNVSAFADYGRLSGKNTEDLRSGARVAIEEAKDDPLDFALWKSAKPGEPSWDSPWGKGRPGWHIECSAMSMCQLGDHFDIHGGGLDLIFPHHENEIAQSVGATGQPFVNTWMHNGFVKIDNEKMSKSLNNFFTVRDVMKKYRAEEIRYFILTSHYRSPLNYSDVHLDQARAALTRFYTALRDIDSSGAGIDEGYVGQFNAAMDDDFNTPEALAIMFELVREINRERDPNADRAASLAATLQQLGGVLGLLQNDPGEFLRSSVGSDAEQLDDEAIDNLVAQRVAAREVRDWAEADRIRDVLVESNVVLEDGADGTGWRRG